MKNSDINTQKQYEYNSGWQRISRISETDKQFEIVNKRINETNSSLEKLALEINNIKSIEIQEQIVQFNEKINIIEQKLNAFFQTECLAEGFDSINKQQENQNSMYKLMEKQFRDIQNEWYEYKHDLDTNIALLSLVIDSIKMGYENTKTKKRGYFSEIFKHKEI